MIVGDVLVKLGVSGEVNWCKIDGGVPLLSRQFSSFRDRLTSQSHMCRRRLGDACDYSEPLLRGLAD